MRHSYARFALREPPSSRGQPTSKGPASRSHLPVLSRTEAREGQTTGRPGLEASARFGGASQEAACKQRARLTAEGSLKCSQPALDCSHSPARRCRASRAAASLLSSLGHCSSGPEAEFDEAFRFEVPLAGHLAKLREKRERLLLGKAARRAALPVPVVEDLPAKLEVDLSCFPGVAAPKRRPPAQASPQTLLWPECLDWHEQVHALSGSTGCSQLPRPRCARLNGTKCRAGVAAEPVDQAYVSPLKQVPSACPVINPSRSVRNQPSEVASPPHESEPCYKKILMQLRMNRSSATNKSHVLTASTAPSALEQAGHDSCPLTRKDYRRSSHEEFRYFKFSESTYRKQQKHELAQGSWKPVPREAEQPREYFGLPGPARAFSPAAQRARPGSSLVRRVAEKLLIANIWRQS